MVRDHEGVLEDRESVVEDRANAEGGDPTLGTAYEKTILYQAVIAAKAVKARKKNEEAKKAPI